MSERGVRSLDTVREVYTPEGVALRLPAAGPVPHALRVDGRVCQA